MPIYPYSFTMPPVNKQDIPSDGVVGEFLGISAGGVLDWLPVAGGGGTGDMLKADNLSGLASYPTARTNLGLGTSDTPTFANLTLTSPSLSSSAPVTISQTWNGTGSTVFTALKVNATTTTGSAATAKILDLQHSSLNRFSVQKDGVTTIGASDTGSATQMLKLVNQYGSVDFLIGGGGRLGLWAGNEYISFFQGGILTLNNANSFLGIGTNVVLARDGADNTLALRNGAAAQTFNVYGTYSSITDYKRLSLSCSATTGDATIGVPFNSVLAVTGGTAPSSIATITFATQPTAFPVGSNVVVAGVTPSGYNGTYVVTASTTSSVSYTVGGPLAAWSSGGTATVSGSSSLIVNTALEAKSVNVTGTAIPAVGIYQQSGNSLGFSVASTLCWRINNSGGFIAGADNTFDIGASGANRPRNVYVGTSIVSGSTIDAPYLRAGSAGGLQMQGRFFISSAADGNINLTNNAVNDFGRLQFGGTTNLFPAIKRNAAGLDIVLANDSGFAPLAAGAITANLGAIVTGGNLQVGGAAEGRSVGIGIPVVATHSLLIGNGGSATRVQLGIQQATGQTGNLFEWINSSSAVMGVITTAGNVGIGTTSPTSKLHVAGNSSPTITVENTLATGYSQFLFKNTAVTGDGFWLNGSAQSGYGGPSSFNLFASSGPMAFHTTSVTNALSIAQSGVATFSTSIVVNSAIRTGFINNIGDSISMFSFVNDTTGTSTYALGGSAPLMRFGGITTSFPAIKRSTVRIQAVLANDSGFTNIQGKLTTDTDYTATVVTPTGFLTLYDAQGTAYRVPCVAAP